MIIKLFKLLLSKTIGFNNNIYHPLVWINGNPQIGDNTYIGGLTIINAKDASVKIGENCDIASFVSINCADSHKKCIELSDQIDRKDISIENNVFIGTHVTIKGGVHIGHHSVISAGVTVSPCNIPPYSLVTGCPMVIKKGYYQNKFKSL